MAAATALGAPQITYTARYHAGGGERAVAATSSS
jgi:hypothetical protein